MGKELKDIMSDLGKKGGPAMVEKYGRPFMSEMGKKGAKKRWENRLFACRECGDKTVKVADTLCQNCNIYNI